MTAPDLSKGIAVDAAHSEVNKMTEYHGVDLETGEIVFYRRLGYSTVNIGEFLAIVEGMKYINSHNDVPRVIFSDSTTAISWVKHKSSASKKICRLAQKAEIYLKACACMVDDIEIIKWDNKMWGEIPADFGRK